MKMKFFAIGLALFFPLMVTSQTTPQRPATAMPPQRPATVAPQGQVPPSQRQATQPVRPVPVTVSPRAGEERRIDEMRRADVDAARRIDGEEARVADGDAPQRIAKEQRLLEEPERVGGRPYRDMLNEEKRISTRHFSEQELEPRFVSTLLWEVSTIHKEEGKLRDARGVDVYILTREGVFLYDREAQILRTIVVGKDVRRSILTPENMFAEKAPVILVYVANAKKQARIPVGKKDFYAAMDCGVASQAAYFFCASENLVTMTMEIDPIVVGKILELKGGDKALLAQPVGFR